MSKQTCYSCHQDKSIDEFHKNQLRCKMCISEYCRIRYAQKKQYILQKNAEYRKTDKGKKVVARSIQKYRKNNPEKRKAHIAVMNALRLGRLQKQLCEICEIIDVEAHHDDYSKPLIIRWFCKNDHEAYHHKTL